MKNSGCEAGGGGVLGGMGRLKTPRVHKLATVSARRLYKVEHLLSSAFFFLSEPLVFHLATRMPFGASGFPNNCRRFANCFWTSSCHGPRRCRWFHRGDDTLVDQTRYKGLPLTSFLTGSEVKEVKRHDTLRFQ